MDELLQKLKKNFSEAEFQELKAAYDFSAAAHEGQKRQTGEPYFIHPCAVVNVLVDLGFDDVSTLVAAFLHDVLEDTQVTADELEQKFGKEVLELVEGVTKLDKIKFVSAEDEQAENLRKMFFAMAKDYRVIIIKLADRLHNMRTLDALKPEKQIKIATQSLKIYAPLAGRLGLSFVKCELEDLAMRYLYPDDYYELVEFIKTKSKERQQFIEKICDELKAKLQELGIEGEVNGRQKHLYGIYKKMLKQGKNIEQIYDISAVRVIVNEVQDCYTVLGAIHTMWMPLPGRFKDYIAMPKPNGYQSLHTTVITKFKETFEIQIRTYEMHRIAEYGIAAHWKYKEGKTGATKIDDQINWLREVMDTQRESSDSHEFLENIEGNVFTDEVYVFTPKGKVLNLPVGSTTVDFAYAIHSAVGNKCIGAKVNGKIVPLNTVLNTGDIVEILTTNSGKGPSRDWIKFVKTASARTKIRQYFKKEMKEENIRVGKNMLELACKNQNMSLAEIVDTQEFAKLLARGSFVGVEELYASIGGGSTNAMTVVNHFHQIKLRQQKILEKKNRLQTGNDSLEKKIVVEGGDNMLIKIANCCQPEVGDDIVGFISQGRGLIIHKATCGHVKYYDSNRIMNVKWKE